MEKDKKVYLLDMIDCIEKIDSYVNGYVGKNTWKFRGGR